VVRQEGGYADGHVAWRLEDVVELGVSLCDVGLVLSRHAYVDRDADHVGVASHDDAALQRRGPGVVVVEHLERQVVGARDGHREDKDQEDVEPHSALAPLRSRKYRPRWLPYLWWSVSQRGTEIPW